MLETECVADEKETALRIERRTNTPLGHSAAQRSTRNQPFLVGRAGGSVTCKGRRACIVVGRCARLPPGAQFASRLRAARVALAAARLVAALLRGCPRRRYTALGRLKYNARLHLSQGRFHCAAWIAKGEPNELLARFAADVQRSDAKECAAIVETQHHLVNTLAPFAARSSDKHLAPQGMRAGLTMRVLGATEERRCSPPSSSSSWSHT